MDVVEVLKVGISGLVFLLALLCFRLLSQLARSSKHDVKVLRAVRMYMVQTAFLAVLVAAMSIVPHWLKGRDLRSDATECELSLGRLQALMKMPNATPESLQNAMNQHYSTCGPFLRKLSSSSNDKSG
jgi:hypothetical protein